MSPGERSRILAFMRDDMRVLRHRLAARGIATDDASAVAACARRLDLHLDELSDAVAGELEAADAPKRVRLYVFPVWNGAKRGDGYRFVIKSMNGRCLVDNDDAGATSFPTLAGAEGAGLALARARGWRVRGVTL